MKGPKKDESMVAVAHRTGSYQRHVRSKNRVREKS